MSQKTPFHKPSRFATPLAYSPTGKPVFLMGGGSIQSSEEIPPAPVQTNGQIQPEFKFTADDIQRARSEEKDKIYPSLQAEKDARKALEDQVSALVAQQSEREKAEADARKAAEDAARAKAESEMSAKDLLAAKEQEWTQRIAQTEQTFQQQLAEMQSAREQEQAALAKEREFAALQTYTQQQVNASQDAIAPELLEFVGGNTQAEIDASIERVKAKSAALATAARDAFNTARSQQRGVSPTGFAPVGGPLDAQGQQRQVSAEDIAGMDMAEYAKFRQQYPGLAGSSSARGLYS